MDTLVKEIKTLRDKGVKYDNLVSRYTLHAEKIRAIKKICDELLNEIDPYGEIKTKNRSGTNYEDIMEEVILALKKGMHIDREHLIRMYELEDPQIIYVMRLIRKLNWIEERKEGRKVIFYARKEVF